MAKDHDLLKSLMDHLRAEASRRREITSSEIFTMTDPIMDELSRSDLCASGQQVRALMERLPRYDIDVDGDIMPDPTGEYLERSDVLAALTPAPQPEGQYAKNAYKSQPVQELHQLDMGDGRILTSETPIPQPAGEAVPVAWRCKDYADGWWLTTDKRLADEHLADGGAVQLLYAHPPQPSETVAVAVAEALSGLMGAYKDLADSGDAASGKPRKLLNIRRRLPPCSP